MNSNSKYSAMPPSPSGGSAAPGASNDRMRLAQDKVHEVVDIMRDNVEKVLKRDEQLSDLERKSEDLQLSSRFFLSHSKKLKMRMWCQDKKMLLILIFVIVLIIVIIALIIAYK